MEALLEGLITSSGGSGANFLEVCFRRIAIYTSNRAELKVPDLRWPEGPNLEEIQALSTRLKFSTEIETNDIFKRD